MGSRFDDPEEEDFAQPPEEAGAEGSSADIARHTAAPRPQPIGRFAEAMTGQPLAGEDFSSFWDRRGQLAERGALGPSRLASSDEERGQDQRDAGRVQEQLAREAQANDLEQRRAAADAQRAADADAKAQAREVAKQAAGYTKMMKDAGALTDMGPDGKETVKTDAQGNPIYKPAIVSDVHAHPETGEPVVDVRDATGKVTKEDAAKLGKVQIDAQTGERYTRENGQYKTWGLDAPTVERKTKQDQVNALRHEAADEELDIGNKRTKLSAFLNTPEYLKAKKEFGHLDSDLTVKTARLAKTREAVSNGVASPQDAAADEAAVADAKAKVDAARPGWEPFETTRAAAHLEILDAEQARYEKRKVASSLATDLLALSAARHSPGGVGATVQDRAQAAVQAAQQESATAAQQGDPTAAKEAAQQAQQTGTLLERARALKAKREAADPHTPEAQQAEEEHQAALGSLYEKTVDPSQWRTDADGVNADDIVQEAAGGMASGLPAVKTATIALEAAKKEGVEQVAGQPVGEVLQALKASDDLISGVQMAMLPHEMWRAAESAAMREAMAGTETLNAASGFAGQLSGGGAVDASGKFLPFETDAETLHRQFTEAGGRSFQREVDPNYDPDAPRKERQAEIAGQLKALGFEPAQGKGWKFVQSPDRARMTPEEQKQAHELMQGYDLFRKDADFPDAKQEGGWSSRRIAQVMDGFLQAGSTVADVARRATSQFRSVPEDRRPEVERMEGQINDLFKRATFGKQTPESYQALRAQWEKLQERVTELRAPRADSVAQALAGLSGHLRTTMTGLYGKHEETGEKVSEGLTDLATMLPMRLATGLAWAVGRSSAEAGEAAQAEAAAKGETDPGALESIRQKAADQAGLKSAATMAVFMAVGSRMANAGVKAAGPAAGALKRTAYATAGATAGNVLGGGAAQAAMGDSPEPSWQDVMWGIYMGLHAGLAKPPGSSLGPSTGGRDGDGVGPSGKGPVFNNQGEFDAYMDSAHARGDVEAASRGFNADNAGRLFGRWAKGDSGKNSFANQAKEFTAKQRAADAASAAVRAGFDGQAPVGDSPTASEAPSRSQEPPVTRHPSPVTLAKAASDAAAAELDRATQQGGVAARVIAMDRAKAFSDELDRRVAGALGLAGRTAQQVNGILGAQTMAVNAALAENPHLATAGVELGRQMRDTYLQPAQVDAAKRVLALASGDSAQSSVTGAQPGNPALADAMINQRVGVLVARDLAGIAQGNFDRLTPPRLAALDRLGYLREGADGQPVLTQDAVPYLPRNLREGIAKQPGAYRVQITPGAVPKLALHDRDVAVAGVAEAVAPKGDAMDATRRRWIDETRKTNPQFAPDIESWKELLSPKELSEVNEWEDLRYKTVAMQGPEKGYKPYKLTAQQKTRLADLDRKYRPRQSAEIKDTDPAQEESQQGAKNLPTAQKPADAPAKESVPSPGDALASGGSSSKDQTPKTKHQNGEIPTSAGETSGRTAAAGRLPAGPAEATTGTGARKEGGASAAEVAAPGAEGTEKKAEPKRFRRSVPPAPGGHDLIEQVLGDVGKLRSRATAHEDSMRRHGGTIAAAWKRVGGEYDGIYQLPAGLRAVILARKGSGVTPDEAAQMLHDAGALREASPDAMWSALASTWKTRLTVSREGRQMARMERAAGKQHAAFEKDALQPHAGAEKIYVNGLGAGDVVEVKGEKLTVTAIDADTEAVTLEDGDTYGIEQVEDGHFIYGKLEKKAVDPAEDWPTLDTEEKVDAYVESHELAEPGATAQPFERAAEPAREAGPVDAQGTGGTEGAGDEGELAGPRGEAAPEDFSLAKPESVEERARLEAAQKARDEAKAKEDMKDRAAARLTGNAGDTTADLFGSGDSPLFDARRDQPQASAPAKPEAIAGTKAVAQRMVNAEERFIAYAMETGGLSRAQAGKALEVYRKAKVITIDAIGGQYTFRDGRFAESQVLRNAAGIPSSVPKIERAARSFENFAITKMKDAGYHNDYLANVVPVEDFGRDPERYPYLLDSEMQPVTQAFQHLFDTLQTRETEKGVALHAAGVQGRVQFANAVMTPPGAVRLWAARPLVAHHGTPHEVDRFSTEKIGTGEGAQAYGWGLYFAENPQVAEEYRKQLSGGTVDGAPFKGDSTPKGIAIHEVVYEVLGGWPASKAIERAKHNLQERLALTTADLKYKESNIGKTTAGWGTLAVTAADVAAAREKVHLLAEGIRAAEQLDPADFQQNSGNTYTVHLDADPDELLDWDKPLSEQSAKVKDAISELAVISTFKRMGGDDGYGGAKGLDFYHAYVRAQGRPELASDYLKRLGIAGIRYADQGSRTDRFSFEVSVRNGETDTLHFKTRADAEYAMAQRQRAFPNWKPGAIEEEPATHNYVIFDESKIRITHRNGEPVTPEERTALMGSKPKPFDKSNPPPDHETDARGPEPVTPRTSAGAGVRDDAIADAGSGGRGAAQLPAGLPGGSGGGAVPVSEGDVARLLAGHRAELDAQDRALGRAPAPHVETTVADPGFSASLDGAEHDHATIARNANYLAANGIDPQPWMRSAQTEERIHWRQIAEAGTPAQFARKYGKVMGTLLHAHGRALLTEFAKVYGREVGSPATTGADGQPRISPANAGAELERMAIQLREDGHFTEQTFLKDEVTARLAGMLGGGEMEPPRRQDAKGENGAGEGTPRLEALSARDRALLKRSGTMAFEKSAGYLPTVEAIRLAKVLFSPETFRNKIAEIAFGEGGTPIGDAFSVEMAARQLLQYAKQEMAKASKLKPLDKGEAGAVDLSASPVIRTGMEAIGKVWRIARGVEKTKPMRDLEAMGPDVEDKAVQHVGARSYAPILVKSFMQDIFGTALGNAAFVKRVGDVMVMDNILGGVDAMKAVLQQYLDKEKADPTKVKASDKAAATKLAAKIEAVEDSQPLDALDLLVSRALAEPEIVAAIERYKAVVTPEMDGLYKEIKKVDPLASLATRGRHFGARVNLMTKAQEKRMQEWGDPTKPMPQMGAGNASSYRNPDVKRDKFDRPADLTAEYSDNLELMLLNSFGPRINEVTKERLYTALEKSGHGVVRQEGEDPVTEIDGEEPRGLNFTRYVTNPWGETSRVNVMMDVPASKVATLRNTLNTEMIPASNPVFQALTKVQVLGVADATAHIKNQISVVSNSLGRDRNYMAVVARLPVLGQLAAYAEIRSVAKAVAAGGPEITKELAALAKYGMLRNSHEEKGFTHRMGNLLHEYDTAARVLMARRYDNLVAKGWAVDTVQGKRAFIMQVGEYNRRLMGAFDSWARDYGMSPFIVAGRTFNRFGSRMVLGEPGFRNDAGKVPAAARAAMLSPWLMMIGTAVLANLMFTGSMFGRKGTPIGQIDLGPAHDGPDGKRKGIDLLQLNGLRRGLRRTGLEAIATGLKDGQGANEMLGKAIEGIITSNAHPFFGPGLGFVTEAVTGKRLDMRQGWATPNAEVRSYDGGKQYLENLRAALKNLNQLGYAIAKPAVGAALGAAGMKPPTEDAGYAAGVGSALGKAPLSAFGYKETVSPALSLARKLAGQSRPATPPDEEKAALYAEKRGIYEALRAGDNGPLRDALAGGAIRRTDVPGILKKSRLTTLQSAVSHLSAVDADRVWQRATPEEQDELAPMLGKKMRSARQHGRPVPARTTLSNR